MADDWGPVKTALYFLIGAVALIPIIFLRLCVMAYEFVTDKDMIIVGYVPRRLRRR